MKKINLMHIIGRLPVGGAENLLLTVARNIDRDRFNLTVCCLDGEGRVAEKIRQEGFRVVCLGGARRRHLYRKVFGLMKILRQEEIDIVHTHLYQADLWGRLIALLAGVPVVCRTEHGDVSSFKNKPFYFRAAEYSGFNSMLDRLGAGVIFISDAQKRAFEKHGRNTGEHFLIHNGIDTDKFSDGRERKHTGAGMKYAENSVVIGVIARLSSSRKGQNYLLPAMRKILNRYPQTRLQVIGDGEDEGGLKYLAKCLKLDRNISFLGMRDDIPELLEGMDILVQPSITEPLGLSILEGMYSGLPVVATDVGGIPEIVRHGETGFLVPPKDPDALADSIMKLIRDRDMAREMGKKGRETVMNGFTGKVYSKKLEKLYTSLLGGKNRRRIRVLENILPLGK